MATCQQQDRATIGRLTEIAYMMAKTALPFTVFQHIAALEKWHGVALGVTYLNEKGCVELTTCVGESLEDELKATLAETRYFSILSDGSTDSGVIEQELFYVLYVSSDGNIGQNYVKMASVSDGSTDSGVIEQELFYVLYVSSDGNIGQNYVKMASVSDGSTDSGVIEQELFYVLYVSSDGNIGQNYVKMASVSDGSTDSGVIEQELFYVLYVSSDGNIGQNYVKMASVSDGSTDSGVIEQELFYVLYVGSDGNIGQNYVKMASVSDGTAEGLTSLLLNTVATVGLDDTSKHTMVGFGADGASVNMGKKKGVAARLGVDKPWLVTVHCFNHRLELAVKDAFAGTFYTDVFDTFTQIYYLYNNSPKRLRELAALAAAM